MKYHFTPTRMDIIKHQTITSVDEDRETLEPSYSAGMHIKYYSHFGKQIVRFFFKVKYKATILYSKWQNNNNNN